MSKKAANEMETRHNLAVVMPAYNESKHIYNNIKKTIEIISGFSESFKIIVVNDGSVDNTEDELIKLANEDKRVEVVSYHKNRGKGYAVRRGIKQSKGKYTAFLDSDLDLSPQLLERFMLEAEEYDIDVVIGSKLHPDSKLNYPLLRKVMSVGYYLYLKVLFGLKVKDTQTGIKLFKTESINRFIDYCEVDGFSFDIEYLAYATYLQMKIKEMPVEVNFSRTKEDKSTIKIGTIFKMIKESLKTRFRIKEKLRNITR